MGRNRQASYAKRKREQERQEKASQKRQRRKVRAGRPKAEGEDLVGDTSHLEKPSDLEVQRAVERAMNPGKTRRRVETPKNATLFVANISYDAHEPDIKTLFEAGGFDVVMVRIARDRDSGQSRGFAFVELASPEQAGEALDQLQDAVLFDRELRMNTADKKQR